jgi:hypothetical protein
MVVDIDGIIVGEVNPHWRTEVANETGLGSTNSEVIVPAAICARIDLTNDLLVFAQIYI